LGEIGLHGTFHKVPIAKLSGGQKSRVSLVDIMISNPHFLILDEPTNHLDMETIDALVDAINHYKGGVLMVTHNGDLIDRTDCVIYECRDATITPYPHSYSEYCNQILDLSGSGSGSGSASGGGGS